MSYVQRFIKYLKVEKRYSAHTITAYRKDLQQYLAYLERMYGVTDPTQAHHQQIRSWVIELLDNDISPRTINRKLSTLKSFYKFLLRQEAITQNPMRKVKAPQTSEKLPVFVQKENMQRLLGRIDWGQGFSALRNRLILEILYATGVRVSELIGIKESDINNAQQQVKVKGKRNKERLIPLSGHLIQMVDQYLAEKRSAFDNTDSHLLVTDKGKKLYPKFVYRTVRQYLDLVTTVEKRSPHVLRHTFATHLTNEGADLNAVKEFLGHANLAATQVYTHNTIEKLKRVYNDAHPKA